MGLAPGVYVRNLSSSPARGVPTDIGTLFAVGGTQRGPTDRAVPVASMTDFNTVFGDRVAWSLLADSLETFFQCGGAVAHVSRVTGPAAVAATKTIADASSGTSLTVTAASPGAWGNDVTVQVTAGTGGGTFALVVAYKGVEVERSLDLIDTQAAAAWAQNSGYIRVTATGANDPAVAAAAALTGGADDTAGVTTASYEAALARFSRVLGAGQVAAPGVTTSAVHTALLAHAAATNRVALLDQPDTGTAATLTGLAASLTQDANAWLGQTFAQWARVRGVTGSTTRVVPYSAVQAGMLARQDARHPWGNYPPAGDAGILPPFVVGVTQTWSDQDRKTLNDAGVVAAVAGPSGQIKTYGVVGLGTGVWRQHHGVRVRMRTQAVLEDVAGHFVFRVIDGQGKTQAELGAAIRGELIHGWQEDAFYGATADDAFTVDTSDAVNTPATKAAGELHGTALVAIAAVAETVTINFTARAAA